MTPKAQKIRDDAMQAAMEYGYRVTPEGLRAPLGKFEGEPYYALYFNDLMMNGMQTDSFDTGDVVDMDVFEITDDERAAFELEPATAYVALHHAHTGFEHVEELTAAHYAELVQAYTNAEESERD